MTKHILMSNPEFFSIDYEINPWMHLENQVDTQLALKQWQDLFDLYTNVLGYEVELVKPQPNLPDMVFTANGGLVVKDKAMVANFRHPDRQGESHFFKQWFLEKDFKEVEDSYYNFEGEGDGLLFRDYILMGYPWRSDYASHTQIGKFFKKEVISLQLTDAKFYHLDTCLSPIDNKMIAIYPQAFSLESLEKLKNIANIIEVSSEDAFNYGLNVCSDGSNIVIPKGAGGLIKTYIQKGFKVYPMDMSEFIKSGGGVKCLTLELH